MTDTAAKLLAGTVTVPSRGRQPITLLDLATHTSGLPFMPELPSEGTAAPYAKADLVRFVNAFKPSGPGPARWEYSNLGYWLLGEALASRASQAREGLLHTRCWFRSAPGAAASRFLPGCEPTSRLVTTRPLSRRRRCRRSRSSQ